VHSEQRVCGCVQTSAGTQSVRTLSALPPILFHGPVHGEPATVCEHGLLTVPDGVWDLVSRVVSDFTVGVRDNGVCLLLRRLCCVLVMSRD